MPQSLSRRWAPLALSIVLTVAATGAEKARKDEQGRWRAIPAPIPKNLLNEVAPEYENGFVDRAQVCIKHNTGKGSYGGNYFENEKASYPPAMFDVVFGDRAKGLAFLQTEDNEAKSWNSLTKGIDYYACFTIKHQMRKYFLLGDLLDGAYRKQMYEGAKLWTEQDPTTRANPYFKKAGDGWTPETKNAWVDGRNTDNLRAMRETSVYLMAEETGNAAVREQYKRSIQRFVWALWNVGMGEWDSENYQMHSFGPYVNLYDFAKDPEVKAAAKAALDMIITMGAVKYYQGGYCGPIKRDYAKPYIFGGAAGELWLYFGDTPMPNPEPHGDTLHLVTSAYRPPMAVAQLARKRFDQPVEIRACKPPYETWSVEGGGSKGKAYPAPNYQDAPHVPAFFETTYIGQTFQFGSLPQGSHGDVNGFKLLMRDSRKGAQFFAAASGVGPDKVNTGAGRDRVAHHRNLALVLTKGGDADWSFLIPEGAGRETVGKALVLRGENTWIALTPINLAFGETVDQPSKKWHGVKGLKAKGTGGAYCGFAMEVGEPGTHGGSYDAFKSRLQKAALDLTGLADGRAVYTAADGTAVGIQHRGDALPGVFANGAERLFDASTWALWQPTDGAQTPVSAGWKAGRLHVAAGGYTFDGEFSREGAYTFKSAGK